MPLDGSTDEEIRRFEEQYRRQPESLVFARLADAYRKAGEPGRALELLEEGIAQHPDYLSAHIVRARTFRDLGRDGDARGAFERVLELDVQNLVAIRGLADLARRGGDPDGERRWLGRLVQADPFNPEPAARLAELEASGGAGVAETREGEPETPGGEPEAPVESEEGPDVESEEALEVEPEVQSAVVAEEEHLPEPWWFDPPETEPGSVEEDIEKDADLLTRTMAELYARQGLLEEAEEIYRELLRDRPDDAELRAGLDAVLGMRAARSATRGTAPRSGAAESGRSTSGAGGTVGIEKPRPEPIGSPEPVEPPRPVEPPEPVGSSEPGLVEELGDLLETSRALGPRLPLPPDLASTPAPPAAAVPLGEGESMDAETSASVLEDWLRRLRG